MHLAAQSAQVNAFGFAQQNTPVFTKNWKTCSIVPFAFKIGTCTQIISALSSAARAQLSHLLAVKCLNVCVKTPANQSCQGAVSAPIMASFLKQLYANWSRYVRGCGIESASVLVALRLASWFIAF